MSAGSMRPAQTRMLSQVASVMEVSSLHVPAGLPKSWSEMVQAVPLQPPI